ncbi:MAG: hypothetical protein PPP56_11335 [Longimonas sp.]|uniref:hypothetical protein n=1 Tax=Longimonas sp. TaxID=2039626 RepID=UPI00334EEB42
MRTVFYIAGVAALSVGLHLLVGWPATVLAGCAAAVASRHVLVGTTGVALGWGVLVLYTLLVHDAPTLALLSFLSEATGGVPAPVLGVLPAGIGALSGALGAVFARALHNGWRMWVNPS